MTPTEASKKKNEGTVYFNLFGDMKHQDKNQSSKLVIRSEYLSTNVLSLTKDTQPIGQKKFLQLTRYNTPIRSLTDSKISVVRRYQVLFMNRRCKRLFKTFTVLRK